MGHAGRGDDGAGGEGREEREREVKEKEKNWKFFSSLVKKIRPKNDYFFYTCFLRTMIESPAANFATTEPKTTSSLSCFGTVEGGATSSNPNLS